MPEQRLYPFRIDPCAMYMTWISKGRRSFRLLWAASPGELLVTFSLATVAALAPPATIWLSRELVNTVANARFVAVPLSRWLPLAILLGCTFAGQRFLQTILLNHQRRFAERVAHYADERFVVKAQQADLAYLEDPQWHDRMARAARSIQSRPANLVHGLIQVHGSIITSVAIAGILFTLNPIVMVLLLAAVALAIPQQRAQTKAVYALFFDVTTKERERYYLRSLLTDLRPAKEIRAYGLGEFLLHRYSSLVDSWLREFIRVMRKVARQATIVAILTAALVCLSYVYIVQRGISGRVTPGGIAAAIISFASLTTQLSAISIGLATIEENSKFLEDFFSFLALPPMMTTRQPAAELPSRFEDGISFKDVTFAYPGTSVPALEHLDLHIRAGELLALVGGNGAGKTTIIKLLLRYYDPDDGDVQLDGTSLRCVEPGDLRSRIGVLFQDYTLFQLSMRDNVAFGDIEREPADAEILAALRAAQAEPLLDRLPNGIDSFLGRLFEGGRDLSTGEQQRVALARLIFRSSDIWILDEPTSALDAEAELAVFARFRELIAGRTGIIISHRFSTVRHADRIAVIDQGQIAELGTHKELMALGGQYARLYEVQASSFR